MTPKSIPLALLLLGTLMLAGPAAACPIGPIGLVECVTINPGSPNPVTIGPCPGPVPSPLPP